MLTVFMFGWTNGQMNSFAPAVRVALGIPHAAAASGNDVTWGWLVSVYSFGGLLGASVSGRIADVRGRRGFVVVNTASFIAGAALQTLSAVGGQSGVRYMLVGRLVVGAASGGATVVIPAYLSEIAPEELRGVFGVGFSLAVTLAMLVAQVAGLPRFLGTARAWPMITALPILPGLVQLALLPKMVESPRWLRQVGREADAAAAVARLEGTGGYVGMLNERADAKPPREAEAGDRPARHGAATSAPGSPSGVGALLADARLRAALAVSVAALTAQQLSGINVAFNFSTVYLEGNHVPAGWIAFTTIGMNVANVGATLVTAWLVDRAGRRVLLLGSTIAMILSAAVITLGMHHIHSEAGIRAVAYGVVLLVTAFGLGLGPIPWIVPSELFAQEHRATAMSVAALANWATNGAVALAFLPIAQALQANAFVPFAGFLLVFALYAAIAMPETRGLRPDDAPALTKPKLEAARASAGSAALN
jgi:sugar porter (SP) family MFS transporter